MNRFILFVAILLSVQTANAQEINFSASVDKTTVALDDTVTYTLTVSGQGANSAPEPTLPKMTNLSVIGRYQSSNVSIINGAVSMEKSYSFTLQPQKTGPASIGSASISINGKTYQTDPIEITAAKASGKPAQPPSRSPVPQMPGWSSFFDEFFNEPMSQFSEPREVKDPVKAKTVVSRNTAYVNQMILLTFTFYRRINLAQPPQYTPPQTIGFWTIDLPAEKNLRQVNLNGTPYAAQDFKTALFPTTPGKFTIGPATLIFQASPFVGARTIKTDPITINVLPLPENGKPRTFGGSVGRYRMEAELKETKAEQGKPLVLSLKISGSGNIQTVSEPAAVFGEEFKKLSSTPSEEIVKSASSVSGSKTFEMVLIPAKAGNLTIPAFEFSFFDPELKQYITQKSKPIPLEAAPSKTPLPKELKESGEAGKNTGIVAIEIPWRKFGKWVITKVTSIYFWLPVIILLISGALFSGYRRYQILLTADPAKFRNRQARRTAKNKLKKSLQLLRQNKIKEFVGEIFGAAADYLGDKYNFSAKGATTDQLKDLLSRKGLAPEILGKIENFISQCDFIRFTPSSLNKEKAAALAQTAEELIVLIERS